MIDNQISEFTKMFIIKDTWLSAQEKRKRRLSHLIQFLSQRVLVVAIIGAAAAAVHQSNDKYSLFVYSLGCTLYILAKK